MCLMFISIPKITNTVMNGNLCNLLRNKNNTTKDAIAIPNVITLKLSKVTLRLLRGLVRALELAVVKNALIFYMHKGKN